MVKFFMVSDIYTTKVTKKREGIHTISSTQEDVIYYLIFANKSGRFLFPLFLGGKPVYLFFLPRNRVFTDPPDFF